MAHKIEADSWVYILVRNPGADDHIVGQTDPQLRISFIPMFLDKDSANQGAVHIPKENGYKYEIQAIIFEDLERYAADGDSLLFVIDDVGKVVEKRVPFQDEA